MNDTDAQQGGFNQQMGLCCTVGNFTSSWNLTKKNVNTRMNVENNHVKMTIKPKIRRQ